MCIYICIYVNIIRCTKNDVKPMSDVHFQLLSSAVPHWDVVAADVGPGVPG